MSNYVFDYSNRARKFLLRHEDRLRQDSLEEALIRAVRKLTKEEENNSDVKPMKPPFKGYERLRMGDIRIIFSFKGGAVRIVSIFEIDFRGGIYL
jgi:mRNA-degrading endonuclease RelE of RelBE toxin-antitoxin system